MTHSAESLGFINRRLLGQLGIHAGLGVGGLGRHRAGRFTRSYCGFAASPSRAT